jgi:hypothetical protein
MKTLPENRKYSERISPGWFVFGLVVSVLFIWLLVSLEPLMMD